MATADDALVREAGQTTHNDDTFARRSDAYLDRALGLACYILGDVHEAEEATQEAMTRAWKSRRSLREPAAFDAWIDRIVVHTCRERLRRKRVIREVELPAVSGWIFNALARVAYPCEVVAGSGLNTSDPAMR